MSQRFFFIKWWSYSYISAQAPKMVPYLTYKIERREEMEVIMPVWQTDLCGTAEFSKGSGSSIHASLFRTSSQSPVRALTKTVLIQPKPEQKSVKKKHLSLRLYAVKYISDMPMMC